MPPGDIPLGTDVEAAGAYYSVQGELRYTREPAVSHKDTSVSEDVGVGQWLCEAALWCHWSHVGSLEARTACKLVIVRSKEFEDVLVRRRRLSGVAWEYAQMFHTRLVASCPPLASWPSDVSTASSTYDEIVDPPATASPRSSV